MPGKDWKPEQSESNAVEGKPHSDGGWRELPSAELTQAEVDVRISELDLDFDLDTSIRLSSAYGGSLADAQSLPNFSRNVLKVSVGNRVVSLGDFWRLVVCGLVSVLVGASLLTYLVASTRLTFCLLIGLLVVIPVSVGVLAQTGRLTVD